MLLQQGNTVPMFLVVRKFPAVFFVITFILYTMQPLSADNESGKIFIDGFTWIEDVTPAGDDGATPGIGRYEYMSGTLRVRCEIVAPAGLLLDSLPTLILCHGGVRGITWRMRQKALELSSMGYLMIMPSYRGEDGSDGEIEIAAGEVDDVRICIDLLRESDVVDSSRMAVIGSSHGALIAALAASQDPSFPPIVSAYGVMDIHSWWYYLVDTGRYEDDDLSRKIYGDGPDDRPDEFSRRSAVGHACTIESPALLMQGANDRLVPPSQAEAMVEAFELCGKENYSSNLYENAGHGFLWWFERDRGRRGSGGLESTSQAWSDIFEFLDESWTVGSQG